MTKWVPNIKGYEGSNSFEISVLRDDNNHGKISYGWMGEDKLYINGSGGPCRDKLGPGLWPFMVELAHRYADHLNEKEDLESVKLLNQERLEKDKGLEGL